MSNRSEHPAHPFLSDASGVEAWLERKAWREMLERGGASGWIHHRFVARFGEAYRGPRSSTSREAGAS